MIVGALRDSVIQFCSTAFAYYAQATSAQEIFGHTLQSLRGIKYLYKLDNFLNMLHNIRISHLMILKVMNLHSGITCSKLHLLF